MKFNIKEAPPPQPSEMGPVLLGGGFPEKALPYLEQAVKDRPLNGNDWCNLGLCMRNLGHLHAGLEFMQKAIVLDPKGVRIWHNLAILQEDLGLFGDAEASFETAHRLMPEWEQPLMGIAFSKMRRGCFLEAMGPWEDHRYWAAHPPKPPTWEGQPISGKKIIVWPEGGAGDQFQFARYLKALHEIGAEVTYLGFAAHKNILAAQSWLDHWVTADGTEIDLDQYDYQINFWSIPTVLKCLPLPMDGAYIDAPTSAGWFPKFFKAKWDGAFTVGIAVEAAEVHEKLKQSAARAVPPNTLHWLPRNIGIRYVGLQLGDLPDWIEDNRGELRKGWEYTARAIQECDLIIAASSGVMHLAASMAKPVWSLIPLRSPWTHGITGEQCSWYPTMRQFRNSDPYDWNKVMQRVGLELCKAVSERMDVQQKESVLA